MQTSTGKEFKLKEFLTTRDRNSLTNVFLKSATIDPISQAVSEISASSMLDAQYKLIELSVTEYDGSADKVLDRLLDNQDPTDYDEILVAINAAFPHLSKKAELPTSGAAISDSAGQS